MDIVLIAGLWLDASAWDQVVPVLEQRGHRPVPLTLPGQGDGSTAATFDDQATAVAAAVAGCVGPVLVVGHSAACTLAWVAADAHPDKVARVAMVGGFAPPDGETYASFFEPVDGLVPFPGWGPFEGPDSDDLTDEQKDSIAARAIALPEAVTHGVVHVKDERRYDVPVTMVCPEYTPDQAREWMEGGDLPELAKVKDLDYVDIDSGHWPMFSETAELARIIDELARR